MDLKYEIVESLDRFVELLGKVPYAVVDCETRGRSPHEKDAALLGFSISAPNFQDDLDAIYIPLRYLSGTLELLPGPATSWTRELGLWLSRTPLVNFNIEFDRQWLDHNFGIETQWVADVRPMLHLADAPLAQRPYNLEQLQADVLKWPTSGKNEMKEHILDITTEWGTRRKKQKDGTVKLVKYAKKKIKKSEWKAHLWKADLNILSKYACLDTYSTRLGYEALAPFFYQHDYWPFLRSIMAYNRLLAQATYLGLPVDREGLRGALAALLEAKNQASEAIRRVCETEISGLEAEWKTKKEAFYKSPRGKILFRADNSRWPRFNPSSDIHLGKLYYDKLGFPVNALTEGGRPKVDKAYLKTMDHPVTRHVLEYNHYEKIAGYAESYLEASEADGRIHASFNICGTVSGRLSGFSPNLQQAPFQELDVMRHFVCPDGYLGIHADLSGIEPCITAHYSEDPTLLKVYRDLQGDIYLDLALELFPANAELRRDYNPFAPVTEELKKRFKKLRDIAKTIHLAVQYGGSFVTVAKNLTLKGYPTTNAEAQELVRAYWRKFRKVKEFNWQLHQVFKQEGMLRNVVGRIIRVPFPDFKDLPNRFIQSSAHDVLVLWVTEIDRLVKERKLDMMPWILDIHDSTTWFCDRNSVEQGRKAFSDALKSVNASLQLCVSIRSEAKVIENLAGLKGD